MCVGSEFQVDGAETENAREVKLLVMPVGLARRFVLEERTYGYGWQGLAGYRWALPRISSSMHLWGEF